MEDYDKLRIIEEVLMAQGHKYKRESLRIAYLKLILSWPEHPDCADIGVLCKN